MKCETWGDAQIDMTAPSDQFLRQVEEYEAGVA